MQKYYVRQDKWTEAEKSLQISQNSNSKIPLH